MHMYKLSIIQTATTGRTRKKLFPQPHFFHYFAKAFSWMDLQKKACLFCLVFQEKDSLSSSDYSGTHFVVYTGRTWNDPSCLCLQVWRLQTCATIQILEMLFFNVWSISSKIEDQWEVISTGRRSALSLPPLRANEWTLLVSLDPRKIQKMGCIMRLFLVWPYAPSFPTWASI